MELVPLDHSGLRAIPMPLYGGPPCDGAGKGAVFRAVLSPGRRADQHPLTPSTTQPPPPSPCPPQRGGALPGGLQEGRRRRAGQARRRAGEAGAHGVRAGVVGGRAGAGRRDAGGAGAVDRQAVQVRAALAPGAGRVAGRERGGGGGGRVAGLVGGPPATSLLLALFHSPPPPLPSPHAPPRPRRAPLRPTECGEEEAAVLACEPRTDGKRCADVIREYDRCAQRVTARLMNPLR